MRRAGFVLATFLGSFGFALAAHAAEPLILQMADGKFYAPAANITAASREEMLQQLSAFSFQLSPTSTQGVTFPLKEAIVRGREMLRDSIASSTTRTVKRDDGDRDVTVAIWDKISDAIRLRTVHLVKGKRAVVGGGLGAAQDELGSNDQVVALRYPLYVETRVNGKKRYQVTDIVYTPSYPSLRTPETIAWGKDTFERMIAEAFEDLRNDGVAIRETVDPKLAKAIALIEHSDRASLNRNGRAELDKLYVTIAANPDNAFTYARSSAGALGLVQFIPKTYASLVRRHPEAKLEPDFERAMSEPASAIKAEIVYLNDLHAALPPEAWSAEFVAAAYNGGPARIKKAVGAWDEVVGPGLSLGELKQVHRALRLAIAELKGKAGTKAKIADLQAKMAKNEDAQDRVKKPLLKKETVDYVLKLRQAMRLLAEDV